MYRKFFVYLSVLCTLLLAACVGRFIGSEPIQATDDLSPGGKVARSPLDPIPGEEKMSRGDVVIRESELLIMESYPLQIMLRLKGELPSACHYLRAEMDEPDVQKRIHVEVYSLTDPDTICIQVLQPFEPSIHLGSFPDGSYTIWVNGEKVGEFTQ